MKTKQCTKCKSTKLTSEFGDAKDNYTLKSGEVRTYVYKRSWCRKCENESTKTKHHNKKYSAHDRLNKIDIAMSTDEGFDVLLKEFGL